ncbi:putative glycolipid-binding domain-containing protein [Vitiosangium sp. GDMCC 1.1324]|uniref:putative glycolipid-binding domain-containing protein n=1 Tax=Vitiosangium sp. (strain GDMCC 1.1324) TaxID=2138576 RepID=UPI000D3C7BD4|nr:putative glycolipid-binding domain-containing protein [Vitiosangium sp. GDMCC 1.1324]PTL77011.1 transcriptional regulator [Vitiosangium sp. GDMCC 1.1324]
MNEQHVAWVPWSSPGHEHLILREVPRGLTAHSSVEGVTDEGRPFSLRYFLRTDNACRVREVELALLGSDSRLALRSDGAGLWSDDKGRSLPELDGCIDVDISASPFTNTLPIRRLGLAPDASDDIVVVYLSVPELAVRRCRQRYICLGPERYLFESLESGFRAELSVDSQGLVLDYSGLFRRLPSR